MQKGRTTMKAQNLLRSFALLLAAALLLAGIPAVSATSQEGIKEYPAEGGNIYVDGSTVVDADETITKVEIPEENGEHEIIAIGHDAFAGCSGLETVVFPASVHLITYGSFAGCTSLKSLYFEGNRPYMEDEEEFRDAAEDLTAADGSVIPKDGLLEIDNCDENGNITFKMDIPVGEKLYVKEIATDSHYILSDEKYPVTFDYAGQDTALVEIKANGGEAIKNDILYGSVKGLKIDRETEKPIVGAKFGLFRSAETEFTAENALITAVSGEDGTFLFENVPYGNWLIKELQPADGYLSNEEIYPVRISENGQTVGITVVNDRTPEIGTKATVNGEKTATAEGDIAIEDTVSYKHLIPGKAYTIKGILMDMATGKAFLVDGKELTSEVTFTPEESCGEVTVRFTFGGSKITKQTDLVVFETLYRDGVELAAHADIEDGGQTVTLIPPKPDIPQTGDNSNLGFWIGLGAVALGGLVAVIIIRVKSRKDEDDE